MDKFKFVSFDSTRKDGHMNNGKAFFPEGMTTGERTAIMRANKQKIAERVGIPSYKNIFINIQKNMNNADKYKDGKTLIITPDILKGYDDLYDLDYYCDIVKLTKETPNIAIAYPVADCAVIKAVNTKTNEAVLSHCGGEYIDRYLPIQTIDALGGNEKDIKVYVSPFAHKLFYGDATNLKWANNPKVWEESLDFSGNSVEVNVLKALKKQLLDRKIRESQIIFSPYDTIKTDKFYSNSMQYQDPTFRGRFLSGIAYVQDNNQDDENIKVIRK